MRVLRGLTLPVAVLALVACAALPDWQSPVARDHPLVGTIRDMAAGSTLTADALVARLAARRYVLLGEKHDNPDHHRLQAWVVRELIAAGRRPAVAFEMFRADQSETIARHLAAAPTDAHGLGDALDWKRSGWPAWSMYEPIAAAALDARLPLVAANLSQAATASVRRDGIAALDAATAARLGLDRPLPEDVRARLAAEISDAHCGQMPERSLDNFIAVQRARDAHMAAALRDSGGDGAVLIAGAGHARRDMGVPRLFPAGEVASVAFLEVTPGKTTVPAEPYDYVWFTPRMDDRDPCDAFRKDLDRLRQR